MQSTPQQLAIYHAVESARAHLVVEALAGTGKTTTAVACLGRVPGKVGFVAFNKHIADELRTRLPPSVQACTLHSLGYAAVRRSCRAATLDEQKLRKLSQELAPGLHPAVRAAAEHLARLCKYTLTNERDTEALADLEDHYGVEMPEGDPARVYDLAGRLVEESERRSDASIDFDDMVWLPVRRRLPVAGYDLLLVDEAQDLNRCQQQLALDASADGRLVPVGDRHQAIYGFSGSDCEALPRLTGVLEESDGRGCRVLPLTVTWRCPIIHVELARRIVPSLEPAPAAEAGTIETRDLEAIAKECRPGDLIICRKNAPLVSLTYRLVLAGVKALMRGREIGKGLLALIDRLQPDSTADLIARLQEYRTREEARLRRKDAPESAFQALEDRCECLGQLAAQATGLDALRRFIGQTFDDQARPGSCVVLSSVHRAKGLEAETVYVLDPQSLPLIHRDSKPWERQQEKNIVYIAATRSKRRLVFQDRVPTILGG